MRTLSSAAVVSFVLAASACSTQDQGTIPLTQPDVSYTMLDGACGTKLNRFIAEERRAIFSGATLRTARSLWQTVVDNCGTPQGQEAMLSYVRFTIQSKGSADVVAADPATAITSHWNPVFEYVGYPAPNESPAVLTAGGAAKVIFASDGTTEFGIPQKAAMQVIAQSSSGDQRGHLFTIKPASAGCLTGTNLVQQGDCYDFTSYPDAAPKFDPGLTVGICTPASGSFTNLEIPALGHLHNGRTSVPTQTAYPSEAFCHGTMSPMPPQFGGVFGTLRRFAFEARRVFGVQPAYAGHGGLGGQDLEDLSPFGPVDRRVFRADFTSDAVNSPPGAPAIGTWSKVEATPPGSILVQDTLGDLAAKPVVLAQAGGACSNCGGLDLWGSLRVAAGGSAASYGKYLVQWQSLQDGPTMKAANFVLRSSDGLEIARLTYTVRSNQNVLQYNGVDVGTWTRSVKQKFEILVDLDAVGGKTSLAISGTPVAVAQNVAFVNSSAKSLSSVRAEFSGIDSGIIGWDNIYVERLEDN